MTRYSSNRTKRQGFTLIEILVVLSIAAIVSAITLGGYKEMTAGNKRVSCQTNLVQIYQAARLYASDEGGRFPYFKQDVSAGTCTTTEGIGLWSLYTFPKITDFNTIAPVGSAPVERYLRSTKLLHCPSDFQNDKLYMDLVTKDKYNPDYLSYQRCDSINNIPTYSPRRGDPTSNPALPLTNVNWKRQLLHFSNATSFVARQPTGDTVVTWCTSHRSERGGSNPERGMDNVLFYDGTVQLLPQNQGGVTGWQRLPKPPV